MDKHVDKGEGVKAIQRALGVTRAQTAAFGDYLNDIKSKMASLRIFSSGYRSTSRRSLTSVSAL